MSARQTLTETQLETKTAADLLFSHYLRTGERLTGAAAQGFLEQKGHVVAEGQAERKSAESVLFEHYLRTGERLFGDAAVQFLERKFNPYHDPEDGRFTFGPGGGSLVRSSQGPNPNRSRSLTSARSASTDDPVGAIIRDRTQPIVRPATQDSFDGDRPDDDPIGDIIRQHEARLRRRQTQPSSRPARPARVETSRRSATLSHWPIAGAGVATLNRADKPREGDPRYDSPRSAGRGRHRGIDIKAPEGTVVRSASRGTVVHVTPNPSGTFGYQVVVFHGGGVYTQYAHLQRGSVIVRPGERIASGQVIARVGRTGNTPRLGDSHLHFEVRLGSSAPAVAGGRTGNPLDYLPK
jgi:murein DD-endopeptidase MepM/ murein hydrolase activator NlpD